ncbi:hypothetical protein V6N11_068887 [Hibiscus sabdariffa]|uniref:RNase H type-1 domain-containing protein n=1 Tax=Hibiscus sabdariffa TaxID=183260 RepID=A0ABR2PBD4_9ROSI
MTNTERCYRHFGNTSLCPSCNVADEIAHHVLRDCSAASTIWQHLVPVPLSPGFSETNLQLWKSCNDLVFNGVKHSTNSILNRAITWACYYSGIDQQTSLTVQTPCDPILWKRPEPGWTCLNVDGAVSSVNGTGSIGGLLRDHEGTWLYGFQKGIGMCNSLHVELWAIFTGLEFAWEHGIEILQVQSDCKEAVQMLNAIHAVSCPFPLVRAIAKLCQRGWVVDITWIARDGNRAADALAKSADSSDLTVVHLNSPPTFLLPLLLHDASCISFDST